ncbi:deleted in malignant brain tumors 1 protein-like isoform X1 [Oreochromis aureus]|uniref:deleted in malignant brain tumors 1 protein-like isoform X1 n=1 Tax=Oreochromis aureus TaxID=47969 RepID=UPI001954A24F|nr:deleted in malignant brain tumors 1 protein-like isoform X1 [Oreochromis aureus]
MWTQQTNFFLLATVSYVSAAADGQIRLAGSGSTRCSGRVEIYHRGSWGTICDDDWDLKDAAVVCRQLNCGTALSATTDAHFGEGTGPIWLHYLVCAGTETSLRKCDHGGFRQQDCGHHEDAGVICLGVRLAGSTLCSGRVEIYHRNSWRTVSDDGWDFTDAQVLCNELDCGTPVNVTHFGEGSGEIWFDNVTCSGNETSLTECRRSEIKSSRLHKYAGVICSVPLQQPSISLTSPNGGLVWGPEGAEITKGSSFVFSCSINSRYTSGCFRLFFSGVNLTEPAVRNSASFSFPAAEYEHQGSYSCVYELLLPSRTFTSAESAPIRLIITSPGILVLLLVLLVVALVLWRRRRARRFDPNVLIQMAATNRYEDDECVIIWATDNN